MGRKRCFALRKLGTLRIAMIPNGDDGSLDDEPPNAHSRWGVKSFVDAMSSYSTMMSREGGLVLMVRAAVVVFIDLSLC